MMIRTSLFFLGLASLSASTFAITAAQIPEPSLMGLMGLGLAGVAVIRRRAKSKRDEDK